MERITKIGNLLQDLDTAAETYGYSFTGTLYDANGDVVATVSYSEAGHFVNC